MVGVAYALSPLTVIVALALIPLCWWAAKDLPPLERRYVLAMLAVAAALRVAAVAWLFVTADPNAGSFAKFFGDEEFFQLRGFWGYSLWMGIPISKESLLYAYDGTGHSSYQTLLVLVQILVGPAPYGIHLLNTLFFLAGTTLLYRVARRSYGPAPALVGFAVVLFLPSLFSWSVSALKEVVYIEMTAVVLLAAVQMVRTRSVVLRALAAFVVVAGVYAIDSVRLNGLKLTLGGIAVGYIARLASLRRWIAVGLAGAALVGAVWIASAGLPESINVQLTQFAKYSRGHVLTPGHSYKLLDEIFYLDFRGPFYPPQMNAPEMARYVVRAGVNYVAQPLPWGIASTSELLFMPEQLLWYIIAALFPVGVFFAFRRDALLTCILAGYTLTNAAAIALNSGNIGTLVRHRALVIPYMAWISAVGFVSLLQRKGNQ